MTGIGCQRALLMQQGYLVLESDPNRPELVFVGAHSRVPDGTRAGLRFAAWFRDIDAALMHFHEGVRRSLKRLEPRCYRVDLVDAIAVADAIDLEHRRVFIDPDLGDRDALDARIARIRQRHQWRDRFLTAVGFIALGVLVAWGVLPV